MDQEKRQQNGKRLVENHIHANASTLVCELSQKPDYMDNLLNLQTRTVWECDSCGHKAANRDALDECCDEAQAGDSTQSETDLEVYEHWIVSDWLGRQLEKRGEIVGEFKGLTIWGRTCTGQAIFLDEVIQEIGSL